MWTYHITLDFEELNTVLTALYKERERVQECAEWKNINITKEEVIKNIDKTIEKVTAFQKKR